MMEKVSKVLNNLNLGLAVLLAVWFVFEKNISLPAGLQPVGRLHPLLLHLPIGMFALYASLLALEGRSRQRDSARLLDFMLDSTATFALLSALSGLLLSLEPDAYDLAEVSRHKNTGVAFAMLIFLLQQTNQLLGPLIRWGLVGGCAFLLVMAGHEGAEITHGANFLFPVPASQSQAAAPSADAPLFSALIVPILQDKCVSCHRPGKSKGGLVLTDTTALRAGGRSGPLFIAGDAGGSRLLQVLLLPASDEAHMPPAGKPQLSEAELAIIRHWIQSGAHFNRSLGQYAATDSFRLMAAPQLQPQTDYDFPAAPAASLRELNSPFLRVQPLYQGSPALAASFFLSTAYSAQQLQALQLVREQLVQLNLSAMPVSDQDLKALQPLQQLERLILNGTAVSEKGLEALTPLTKLSHLSLNNTAVGDGLAAALSKFRSLRYIYLTNTRVTPDQIARWRRQYPEITFEYSRIEDNPVPLTPPLLKEEKTIIEPGEPVVLQHPIKGVQIRYTDDGSAPDSSSSLYDKPLHIGGSRDIRAIAVKEGWLPSEVATYSFFEKGMPPQRCQLLARPNSQYPGLHDRTFTNGERAPVVNLRDANWIAFREEPFNALFSYAQPQAIRKISFGYALHVPQYVFGPTQLQVYGGNERGQLELLATQQLPMFEPSASTQVASQVVHLKLPGKACKYYRIEAQNLPVIPSWHPGRGEKGWLFIDEIFFYN